LVPVSNAGSEMIGAPKVGWGEVVRIEVDWEEFAITTLCDSFPENRENKIDCFAMG
jgi:hypothetical protein